MKNKLKKPQFPSISRVITENKFLVRVNKQTIRLLSQAKFKKIVIFLSASLTILILLVLIIGISLLSIKIYQNLTLANKLNLQREKLQSQINFWNSVVNKYPGYKDSYFRIAVLEYSLGDFKKSEEFNAKALLLDPNYTDAKKLELLLSNN